AGQASGDAVFVGHGQDIDAEALTAAASYRIVAQQSPNQSLDYPISARLPGMSSSPKEDAKRCGRIAHAHHLQGATLHGLADVADLDQRLVANLVQQMGK